METDFANFEMAKTRNAGDKKRHVSAQLYVTMSQCLEEYAQSRLIVGSGKSDIYVKNAAVSLKNDVRREEILRKTEYFQ